MSASRIFVGVEQPCKGGLCARESQIETGLLTKFLRDPQKECRIPLLVPLGQTLHVVFRTS